MTIFFDFDPATLANNVRLDSVGFTEYQALDASGNYVGSAANWRRTTANDAAGGRMLEFDASNSIGPRALVGSGSAMVRLEVSMRNVIDRSPNTPAFLLDTIVPFARDDKNFIYANRFGNYGSGNEGLVMYCVRNGMAGTSLFPPAISDWPLPYINLPNSNYDGEPSSITFRYDFVTKKAFIDVEGIEYASIDVPTWLQDPSLVGYYDRYHTYWYPAFKLRDNNDLIDITKPDYIRHGTTSTCDIVVPVKSNITGATGVNVTVRDSSNNIVAGPNGTPLTSGMATVTIGPIPKNKEMSPLKISATNVGGSVQTTTISYRQVEVPNIQSPSQTGINTTFELYYTYCPFNDLVKMGQFRIIGDDHGYGYLGMPWNTLTDWPNLDPLTAPASYVNMTDSGVPLKFPDTGAGYFGFIMPMYPEAGTYMLDMSECPNANWVIGGTKFTPDKCSIEYGVYGPGKHKLVITEAFIPLFVDTTPETYLYINFNRAPGKPNNGLPTTEWSFRCIRVGSSPDMVWSPGYLAWCGGLGLKHKRYMDGQLANEPSPSITPRSLPARSVPRLTDTVWQTRFLTPAHPPEAIAQLHNHLGWDVWLNFSRLDSDAAIQEKLTRLRAKLSPSLKIYATVSNEIWNSAGGFINQYIGYTRMGTKRGLGLVMPVTGWIGVNNDVLNVTVAGPQPIAIGMRVRSHGQGDTNPFVYVTAVLTGTGGTGTYKISRKIQYGFGTSSSPQKILCDLAKPATDMGTYPESYLSWVSGGTYAIGDRRDYQAMIYECIQASAGRTAVPGNDTAYWREWQNANQAKNRAYIEDIFRIRDIAAAVYGSQTEADGQVKYICESFALAPFEWNEQLAWGNGSLRGADILFGLAVDTYFGGRELDWSFMSADDRNTVLTTTGATRRNFFKSKIDASAEKIWRQFRSNKLELVKRLRGLGLSDDKIQLCSYEGGQSMSIKLSAAVTAGASASALSQDIFDFYTADFEAMYVKFFNNLLDQVGGLISHYHQIWPAYKGWNFNAVFAEYLMWQVSNSYKDTETSSRYRGLRTASLAHGGSIVSPPGLLASRRRSQPIVYRITSRELI
jgi:hypothetical protein